MGIYLSTILPRTKKELKKIDFNKYCFLQNNSFSPNADCAILSFCSKPLKKYLDNLQGANIRIAIERVCQECKKENKEWSKKRPIFCVDCNNALDKHFEENPLSS